MNDFVKIARMAIDEYVKNGKKIINLNEIDSQLLNKKAGVFVSIRKTNKNEKEGELRGCIGTYTPTKENIASEIISNAISAASSDYRFAPIKTDELDDLQISVDVLSEPRPVFDITELNPKKYGVLIRSKNDERSGLLLPNIEGVNTIHDQLAIVANKAGLSKNDPVDIFYFEVKRYKED